MEGNRINISKGPVVRKGRNPWIECCRVLASFAVIMSHCKLPGTVGTVIDCLDRFSVPFFFMVSGYFVYQATEETVQKRTRGILKMNILATLLYLVWGCYKQRYLYGQSRLSWLKDRLSLERLAKWFINCENPFAEHLWYLAAMLVCYILFRLYVRWHREPGHYKSLYLVGLFLFVIHFMLASGSNAADFYVPNAVYRNGLFYGLPMFSLGLFLREYEDHILSTYRLTPGKLVLIMLVGIAFSLLEWFGIGTVEMPIATLLEVMALMLLLTSMHTSAVTNTAVRVLVSHFADLSAYIYVTHIIWKDVYKYYVKPILFASIPKESDYFRPFVVIFLSVLTGCLWLLLKTLAKKAASRRT